jgi:transcriptional regulator with XRE-family HTH domain
VDRFEFGALVSSLREDLRWTQQELADKSGVDVAAISNIERGARRNLLKDNILVKLADAFQLTTLERQEFLFAASGVGYHDVLRKQTESAMLTFDSGTFITNMGERVGRITLPAFVTDAFCDILLVNHCLLEFYNVPRILFDTAGDSIGGYNQMRYVFHADSNFKTLVGEDQWDQYALINARYFRRRSLRVRSKPYFTHLLNELLDNKKYPSFERCWRRMVFESHDDFQIPFDEPNEESAQNFVAVESLLALTPYGDLYLQQLLPTNQKTANRVADILEKVGQGYLQLAPFPDKQKR